MIEAAVIIIIIINQTSLKMEMDRLQTDTKESYGLIFPFLPSLIFTEL